MKNVTTKPAIRYSQSFKLQIVRELESGQRNYSQIRRKYGIGSCGSLRRWVRLYGNGTIGKIIRVEQPKEINQVEELKRRIRTLEKLIVDTNVDLALERAYTEIACERAGITDIADFKKKNDGRAATGL